MALPKPYTTKNVGEHMNVTPRTIIDWIHKGCPTPNGRVKLRADRFGKGWRIWEEDLVLFKHRIRPSLGERPDLDVEDPE